MSKKKRKLWTGTLKKYLKKLKKHPELNQIAAAKLYQTLIEQGEKQFIHPLSEEEIKIYTAFQKELFGKEKVIYEFMDWLHAAARGTETGKRILVMVGPTSSGKSTIAALLKKNLEGSTVYAVKGCPIHENPLRLIPQENRKEWEKKLGIKIKGEPCPRCQLMLKEEYADQWKKVPVEEIRLSEHQKIGITTFQPSDPQNQDISELIGEVNLAKITQYKEDDPRCYEFNGELEAANRGMIEYIEILKADIKFHHVLISLSQEGLLKAPKFPMIDMDIVIISHTNETEFESFRKEKKNEALHSRMYPIHVPHVLQIDEEIKIYEKLIKKGGFQNIHIAPETLKIAALFAVMTRLYEEEGMSLLKKAKLYNKELGEDETIDPKEIYERGKENREGMFGLDSRFIMNAINIAMAHAEDNDSCLFPLDIIRTLRDNLKEHDMTVKKEEERNRYLQMLIEDVVREYEEIAKKEVSRAFNAAHQKEAQKLFEDYIANIGAYVKKEKVTDPFTGNQRNPDEILMQKIEKQIGVSKESRDEFRKQILAGIGIILSEGKKANFEDFPRLKKAIENKLFNSCRSIAVLGQIKKLTDDLKKRGYCEKCAKKLIKFVYDLLLRK